MTSQELRQRGREALAGKWLYAIVVCVLADLMSIGVNAMDLSVHIGVWAWIAVSLGLGLLINGVASLGLARYFVNLISGNEAKISDLLFPLRRIGKAVWMNMVLLCYVFLWSLLFLIPGVIALYRYSMVPYLIAEFPDLTVAEAMEESSRLMQGNKLRLFFLHFSFIGWILLCFLVPYGLGIFLLTPYMQAADAAFYMDVTGRSGMRYKNQQS